MNDPEARSERKILITGASGLLGRSLAARLESEGNVTGLGFSTSSSGLLQADLRDPEALEETLDTVSPDVVIHPAAYRDPDFCEEHPAEAARLNLRPVERFCATLPESVPLVFISSDYVFDGGSAPYREEDERRPVNEYGRLKVLAEDLVLGRRTGLVLRIPLLIGAGPTWEASGFVSKTLARIQDPSPFSLDHLGVRFPTWIEDVAEAVVHLLDIGASGIYHYSSLEGGTKYEWALELADLAGLPTRHITPNRDGEPSRAQRPGDTQLEVEKIRQTGLNRFTPFREAVRSILRGFEAEK